MTFNEVVSSKSSESSRTVRVAPPLGLFIIKLPGPLHCLFGISVGLKRYEPFHCAVRCGDSRGEVHQTNLHKAQKLSEGTSRDCSTHYSDKAHSIASNHHSPSLQCLDMRGVESDCLMASVMLPPLAQHHWSPCHTNLAQTESCSKAAQGPRFAAVGALDQSTFLSLPVFAE